MAIFECTVIRNKQEVVITVTELWNVPEDSIKVESNTTADVGMFLHVKSRVKDLKKQMAEMEELIDHLDAKLSDMEEYDYV